MQLRLVVVSSLLVVGCTKRIVTPPKETLITVGTVSAPVRNWAGLEGLCDVPPESWAADQQAMSALLANWLGQTSAPADGAWDDEHVALLEQGLSVLPTPLDQQRKAIDRAKAEKCPFKGLNTARELNDQATRRIEEGPWLATQVKARLALAKWKYILPAMRDDAKTNACITKMKPKEPILYFAAEDENAKLEWLFCDGSKVIASPGNPPAWEANPSPTAKKPKKEPDPKLWLDIAAKYPAESVSRAPKVPKKKATRGDDAAEPDDKL